MQEIYRGIYYEDAYPGVTLGALILPHGTLLVDAPLRADDARSWRASLLTLGSNTNRLLVNLDAHPDRTLGARAMECMIIAHQKTAQVFRNRPSIFKGQNAESGSEWETQNETVGTRWALPDITFTNKLSLHWGQTEIVIEHHPGTAAGALWVIVPSAKVIFVGDVVVHNQPPFLANADLQAWIESLDVLQADYQGYTIISGRGGPVPFEAINTQEQLLKNILKSLERIAKHDDLPEETEILIPELLADLKFPPKMEELYIQRFRHGLSQYYTRRYHPVEALEQI